VRSVQRKGDKLGVDPLLNLGTAGSIASLLSLVIGFTGGLWWRRVRALIASDRKLIDSLLGLFEIFHHLQEAEQVLGARQIPRPSGRRTATVRVREALEIQRARDGLIRSQQNLNTFFRIAYEIQVPDAAPLVRAARFYRLQGQLFSAIMLFERALALSEDGKNLSNEERRACMHGLQYCAIVHGDREEAARWAREAATKGIEGCIAEKNIQTWFVVYRCALLLRLALPNPWGRSRQRMRSRMQYQGLLPK
jgi:hypothetical protein